MTGSPVFKFNSHLTKKQKIQRKLNFVRDVPRNPLRLHIDNLLAADSDKNSDSQEEKEDPKRAKSFSSLSSFDLEGKRGVKRKLHFDADDVSDEVSSFRFSNQNISLNGFHSRASSLGDAKSATISPAKNRYHRSSCTRSSVASTCRRRLFADAEPEPKRPRLESPVLCPRAKRKEVRLSLKKRFPGVPNSDAARSGLLLNLAFSKYNMLNHDKEQDVSVGFVDKKNAKSSSKKELLQYSSIKKDTSSFRYSPVFQAIKKVKRKLNLEEQDLANRMTTTDVADRTSVCHAPNPPFDARNVAQVAAEASERVRTCENATAAEEIRSQTEKCVESVAPPSPMSVQTQKSAAQSKGDLFKNSRLRSTLRTEIFNLSKPFRGEAADQSSSSIGTCQQSAKRSNFGHSRQILMQRNSLACVKSKPTCDRIVVNKDLVEDRNSSRMDGDTSSFSRNSESVVSRSVKRWFDDSFYRDKRSDLRKSLFHRRHEAFLDSHIERFLNDCAQVAESGVLDELSDSQGECNSNESKKMERSRKTDDVDCPLTVIEDVESPVSPRGNTTDVFIEEASTDTEMGTATRLIETSRIIESKTRIDSSESNPKKVEHCQKVLESDLEPEKAVTFSNDFIIEDSSSQEINKHCVEEVELFIENADSRDSFAGFTVEDGRVADNTFREMKNFSIFDETANDALNLITIDEESVTTCTQDSNRADPELVVEEVLSSESVSEEMHITATETNSTPSREDLKFNQDETFDSSKKRKRKRCYSDDLVGRLERLICREKSEMRIWEYEMSKINEHRSDARMEPAIFRVQKMWKEFSRLILQCTLVSQDASDKLYEVDRIKDFGVDASNSVVIVMESSTCPKTLTYSSVFKIHPPWNILNLEKYDCVIIVRPLKVEIISNDDESPTSTELTLPDVLKERQFCSCTEACSCSLPEGYQTVIQPLLFSNSLIANFKSSSWRNYDEEYFKCSSSVRDAVLKHKLFSSEHLFLNLCVLYIQKNFICNGCTLWRVICIDEKKEICCVVIEDEMKTNIPVDRNEFFRFSGILPWKVIPIKNVPSFIDYVEFHGISGIGNRLGSTSLYIFVLSKNFGKIERLA